MDNWKKRAAVLTAFGLVFGAIIFAVKSIGANGPDALPVLEPPEASAEKKASATDLTPAASAPPVVTPRPSSIRPRQSEAPQIPTLVPRKRPSRLSKTAKGVYELFGANISQLDALGTIFRTPRSERGGEIDRDKIEIAVRSYIARYRPHLDLSDSSYIQLTNMVIRYRSSDNERRLSRGTDGVASLRELHTEDMQRARDEFIKMTRTEIQDLFGAAASNPSPFGR